MRQGNGETGKRTQGALNQPRKKTDQNLSRLSHAPSKSSQGKLRGHANQVRTWSCRSPEGCNLKKRHHSRINARHHCPGQRESYRMSAKPLLPRLQSSSQCLRTENSCETALHNRRTVPIGGGLPSLRVEVNCLSPRKELSECVAFRARGLVWSSVRRLLCAGALPEQSAGPFDRVGSSGAGFMASSDMGLEE